MELLDNTYTKSIELLDLVEEQSYTLLNGDTKTEEKYKQQTMVIIEELYSKYNFTYLGEGNTRIGLRTNNKNVVIKIPKNEKGIYDNLWEVTIYKNSLSKEYKEKLVCNNPKYASCKLHRETLIFMEYVEVDFPKELLNNSENEWVYSIDCTQVGIGFNGYLVAYDYA